MPRNPKQAKDVFVGEAAEPGLIITDIHLAWDGCSSVRQRLRDGIGVMHSSSGLSCDNGTCKLNSDILLPILHCMSENNQKKLPSVGDLRTELGKIFTVNKRVGADIQGLVASEAIHIRKLLSFVKAKARRGEVSKVMFMTARKPVFHLQESDEDAYDDDADEAEEEPVEGAPSAPDSIPTPSEPPMVPAIAPKPEEPEPSIPKTKADAAPSLIVGGALVASPQACTAHPITTPEPKQKFASPGAETPSPAISKMGSFSTSESESEMPTKPAKEYAAKQTWTPTPSQASSTQSRGSRLSEQDRAAIKARVAALRERLSLQSAGSSAHTSFGSASDETQPWDVMAGAELPEANMVEAEPLSNPAAEAAPPAAPLPNPVTEAAKSINAVACAVPLANPVTDAAVSNPVPPAAPLSNPVADAAPVSNPVADAAPVSNPVADVEQAGSRGPADFTESETPPTITRRAQLSLRSSLKKKRKGGAEEADPVKKRNKKRKLVKGKRTRRARVSRKRVMIKCFPVPTDEEIMAMPPLPEGWDKLPEEPSEPEEATEAETNAKRKVSTSSSSAPFLTMKKALQKYFQVEKIDDLRDQMVEFAKKFNNATSTPQWKFKMKGDLQAPTHHGLTHYWTRCSCGILRKWDKKEIVNFSSSGASADLDWAQKMCVVMKGGEMFAVYLDGLLEDNYIAQGAYDHECIEVEMMKDGIRDMISSAMTNLALVTV
ncbi:unnamed protein product [Symbiodinium sp. CCMP2456]|nr:unnamed protein product [Symbiodinium sp. CCMP2456]